MLTSLGVMKRTGISFLCLSLVMCVIVGLQLVNHFVMFQKSEADCMCSNSQTKRDFKRSVNMPEPPAASRIKQRTLDEYVDGLLQVLNEMSDTQQSELGENFSQLNEVLNDIKESRNGVKNSRKLTEEIEPTETRDPVKGAEIQEICPEKFLGKSLTYGYPFFRKGFATLNCTQFVPVKDLVTVVFDDVYTSVINPPAYERVLRGLSRHFPEVNVVYITKDGSARGVRDMKNNVKVVPVDGTIRKGEMWSQALEGVKTKYVLIAPNLVDVDDDVDLKRLIRILSHNPDVAIASAAYRTRNGHWDIGCQQMSFRNYTLTLQGGYYLSFWECVVCDFAPGPWLARTQELKQLQFDQSLDFGVFHDIFWKMKKMKRIAVSCPDVMFNIDQAGGKDAGYLNFARKYDIKKIVEPNGRVRWYGCRRGIKHRRGSSCSRPKGLGVPPCDLENLADAIKLIMKECEEAGLFCELQEGTLLGAVKFNKVLPWERDADLTFLTANYTAFKNLGQRFTAAGFTFRPNDNSVWCCADGRQAGGKFAMSIDGWSIELYGQHLMESEMLVARGEAPTKVDFAGQMVTVMRNPGLFARNRYGKNIYRHQEHWLDRGKSSGWHFYNPGKFEKCPDEGHSGCLSQYSIDGNMQFDNNICPCTSPSTF